jgi:hypothetical protein
VLIGFELKVGMLLFHPENGVTKQIVPSSIGLIPIKPNVGILFLNFYCFKSHLDFDLILVAF